MTDKTSLGDRMKGYEAISKGLLIKNMPVVVRVDGKAFHSYCSRMEKPFDSLFMSNMLIAAMSVAEQIQGFKFGYVQSDEASFVLTDYDTHTTQGWFNYNRDKIVSISSAMMSHFFAQNEMTRSQRPSGHLPIFDSRAFNVPREDVINCILWRAKDFERNSISAYAQANFSHKELHGKSQKDMHDMLHSIGKNWTKDLTDQEKNGSFISRGLPRFDVLPTFDSIKSFLEEESIEI